MRERFNDESEHRESQKRQKEEKERQEFDELRKKMSQDKERQEDMRSSIIILIKYAFFVFRVRSKH